MSSILRAGLAQPIFDPNIEQPSETTPTEQGSHNPQHQGYDSEANSPNDIRLALATWGQDLPVGLTQDTQNGQNGDEYSMENRGQGYGGNRGPESSQNGGDYSMKNRRLLGYRGQRGLGPDQNGGGNQASPSQPTASLRKPATTTTSGATANSNGSSMNPKAPSPKPGTTPSGSAATSGSGSLGPNVPSALQPYVQEIDAASKQTGVPASLIGAQILQESGGNPNAVTTNPVLGLHDTGLMQVDQATFQGLQQQYPSLLGGKSVSDPATNIMAGSLYIAQLLKQNGGDVSKTLTAYNGGADPNYVNEVTSKMTALKNGTPVPGGFS